MLDPIDYYNRYAVPYYEETVGVSMEEVMESFLELLPENAEVLDLGCGSGRDTVLLEENGCYVTPLDGSKEMCKLAEVNTDKEVLLMRYEEMNFDEVFEGVWACAALVHLPLDEMKDTLQKIVQALKPEGILYFSVHKGDRDGIYGGRYFRDYSKKELTNLLDGIPELELLELWTTTDVRTNRPDRKWLNVLAKKTILEVK